MQKFADDDITLCIHLKTHVEFHKIPQRQIETSKLKFMKFQLIIHDKNWI